MKLYQVTQEAFKEHTALMEKSKEGFDLSQFVNQREASFIKDDVGHVYVTGMLLHDTTPIERQLGCTDYQDIIDELDTLVSNGAKSAVLHVNSGGGTVKGAVECAEYIQTLPIPIVASIEGMACSAAYKLVSGATWVVSTKSSDVGNIGTIMVYMDASKIYENMGIKFQCFVNDGADLKSTGHVPGLSEEQIEFLQESINEAGQTFKDHVLANRPNIDPVCFKAGWYDGKKAMALGLIDEIGNEYIANQRAIELSELVKDI